MKIPGLSLVNVVGMRFDIAILFNVACFDWIFFLGLTPKHLRLLFLEFAVLSSEAVHFGDGRKENAFCAAFSLAEIFLTDDRRGDVSKQ